MALTPEQRFVFAIIGQAYTDLLSNDRSVADSEIVFLTERYDAHANWRNVLASMIDVDGDAIAQRIRAILNSDQPFPKGLHKADCATTHQRREHAAVSHAKRCDRARARWQHLIEVSGT